MSRCHNGTSLAPSCLGQRCEWAGGRGVNGLGAEVLRGLGAMNGQGPKVLMGCKVLMGLGKKVVLVKIFLEKV